MVKFNSDVIRAAQDKERLDSIDSSQIVWYPLPGSQRLFLTCPLFEVLYEGTRGGGKTDSLLMDFVQHVGRGYKSDWRGILFRQTYKQLTDVISKSRKWIPQIFPGAKFNASEHHWTFPSGEMLLLRQFMREDDYWNFHGHEYPWIGWEELCNWHSDAGYKRMMSCCRSSNAKVPRKIRSTTNPYGPGHNWVKMRFNLPQGRYQPTFYNMAEEAGLVSTDSSDENRKVGRVAIPSSIHENTKLLEADPDYIDRLKASARNEAELQAWLYGSWDIVAGGMFDDVWQPATHIVAPFAIPEQWRIDRSFDWGSSAPFSVGWWAESDGCDVQTADGQWISTVRGDLYRIGEWYGWNGKPNEGLKMLSTEIARGIIERELKMGILARCKAGAADTSIFNVENGVCIAEEMSRPVRLSDGKIYKGAFFSRADKSAGSRVTGWELVRQMLKQAIKPAEGLREKPGLFVFSNCHNFIRTVPVLPRDPKNMDDVDTSAEDHIADEVRYKVRSLGNKVVSGRTIGLW